MQEKKVKDDHPTYEEVAKLEAVDWFTSNKAGAGPPHARLALLLLVLPFPPFNFPRPPSLLPFLRLEAFLGSLGAVLGPSGPSWGLLWPFGGPLGGLLGRFGGLLGRLRASEVREARTQTKR